MFPKKQHGLLRRKYFDVNEYKFRVEFLDDAKEFLDGLDEKPRKKIVYNVWKSRSVNDNELFKKLQDDIWEIERAKKIREQYFNEKNKKNENI